MSLTAKAPEPPACCAGQEAAPVPCLCCSRHTSGPERCSGSPDLLQDTQNPPLPSPHGNPPSCSSGGQTGSPQAGRQFCPRGHATGHPAGDSTLCCSSFTAPLKIAVSSFAAVWYNCAGFSLGSCCCRAGLIVSNACCRCHLAAQLPSLWCSPLPVVWLFCWTTSCRRRPGS